MSPKKNKFRFNLLGNESLDKDNQDSPTEVSKFSIMGFIKDIVTRLLNDIPESGLPKVINGRNADNVFAFPPPFPRNENEPSSDGSGEVIILQKEPSGNLDIEGAHISRHRINSKPGREILNILLLNISTELPRKDFGYESLEQHLNLFLEVEEEIKSNSYDSLFSFIRFLRSIDVNSIITVETIRRIKEIAFHHDWDQTFDPMEEFCDAFAYILETNQANNIKPIGGKY